LIDEQGKIARVYDAVAAREHPAQVLKDVTGG
jgi:peroxiredoxin